MTDSQENKSKPLKTPKPTGGRGPGAYLSDRNTLEPGRPLSGGSLPRRSLAGLPRAEPRGETFGGNENKPLTPFSNRNSNDSRKLATLSESMRSQFLIATKLHFSEEKAKRE
jgi:hypothetical protein